MEIHPTIADGLCVDQQDPQFAAAQCIAVWGVQVSRTAAGPSTPFICRRTPVLRRSQDPVLARGKIALQ